MTELKSIILTFENTDTLEIDLKYIRDLYIKHGFNTIEQLNYEGREVRTCTNAQEVYFVIKESKKLSYKPFNFFDVQSVYSRLTEFNDITHITLVHFYGSEKTISIPYEEGYNDNKYQTTKYLQDSDKLVISIKEKNLW